MARDLTANTLTEIDALFKRPIMFFQGEFASGFIRVWTGIGSISWNSETWEGLGHLISISPISEVDGIKAQGIRIGLSGIPAATVSVVIGQLRRHKIGKVYLGFLDSSDAVIADPYLSFEGRLDTGEMVEGSETAIITLTYENRLIDLERIKPRRYTDQDQRIDFPQDRGLKFVTKIQDWNGQWGPK